jgi:predicted phosphoribosyltransferase
MKAAIAALQQRRPSRIVVAVPVASQSACQDLAGLCDEIVCAVTPEPFFAVGLHYRDFSQTADDEVRELLSAAHGEVVEQLPHAPAT